MLHFLHSIVYYLTKFCRSSAVSLHLTASGPQPPPCLSNTYIFIQNWPCTGARHQSALCLQPLRRCASPLCYVPLWVGPGYWIVCGFVLARNRSSFFSFFSFSAPKSWPIYSNPIIIEAWLSGVIDGTLSEPGYCWHTCCFGYTATD